MDRQSFRDELRFNLSGCILDIELTDSDLDTILNAAFRETQRYIDTTRLATIPFSRCIDLTNSGVSTVVGVYRTQGYLGDSTSAENPNMTDPMYAAQWQLLSGAGTMTNLTNWIYNFGAWNTLSQIRNTMSTDLAFKFDKHTNKLYINIAQSLPEYITVEYIPLYTDISEVVEDYWIDIIMRFAVAYGKIALGRARTRFSQSNAVWGQDGEIILNEGKEELDNLRQKLEENSQLFYPVD